MEHVKISVGSAIVWAVGTITRELRDVVFEDVGFEHNKLIDLQQLKLIWSPRLLRRADLCPIFWLSSRDLDVKLSCYMC